MVHFFGILYPDFGERAVADEAPGKTDFFGGTGRDDDAEPLTRAEEDAAYLSGKHPDFDPIEAACARPHAFVMRYTF